MHLAVGFLFVRLETKEVWWLQAKFLWWVRGRVIPSC